MTAQNSIDIKTAFNNYKRTILLINSDLTFWKSFMDMSIKDYKNGIVPDTIYEAIFAIYEIDFQNNPLRVHKEPISIQTLDLEHHRKMFFLWVINLSALKAYTALETFLLQIIWLKYFPTLSNPVGKKNADALLNEIKRYLEQHKLSTDTKNNRNLIEFFKHQSSDFEKFSQSQIRDLKTTWSNFFELLSILRNIISHQGTLVNQDAHNEMKSKAKDLFERYFLVEADENGDKHLMPKEEPFIDFLQLISEFAANSAKFIFQEKDLKFLGLFGII